VELSFQVSGDAKRMTDFVRGRTAGKSATFGPLCCSDCGSDYLIILTNDESSGVIHATANKIVGVYA
jgi:hypothetical protein